MWKISNKLFKKYFDSKETVKVSMKNEGLVS